MAKKRYAVGEHFSVTFSRQRRETTLQIRARGGLFVACNSAPQMDSQGVLAAAFRVTPFPDGAVRMAAVALEEVCSAGPRPGVRVALMPLTLRLYLTF